MQIAVFGAGAWGTALAASFAQSGRHTVTLWGRDANHLAAMRATGVNQKYLAGIALPPALAIEADFARAVADAELFLIVTSTSGLAATVDKLPASDTPIVWACKGFERDTGRLPHEVVAARVPSGRFYGALSGPSFADEVARGLPCALTLAANDAAFAQTLGAALNGPALRVYSSADMVGVELGGALKNVMAIAAGLSDGMQLGLNARAALVTRGLAEMVRLGVAMGGKPETFMGLTGVGDLILTATGNLSRNRKVGMLLAEGRRLADILASLGHVAEGVNSAAITYQLAKRHSVAMPITEAVHAVLFEDANPRDAVKALLSREARAE
jgi:glycerol-3-phosphate dehydrogenase (NAD(P)+)